MIPDIACHATGWAVRRIDDRWCIGMEGNLDTIHDAVLVVNRHGSHEDAEALARWVADRYNEALAARPTFAEMTLDQREQARQLAGDLLWRETGELWTYADDLTREAYLARVTR